MVKKKDRKKSPKKPTITYTTKELLLSVQKKLVAKDLKLKKFFLRQLFKNNNKIFHLTGILNRKFLKKLFIKRYLINDVLMPIDRRLDINLVRSHFFPTVKLAQQAINYGYIYVNQRLQGSEKYLLKQYDVITINPSFYLQGSSIKVKTFFIRYKLVGNTLQDFKKLQNIFFNIVLNNFNVSFLIRVLNSYQVSFFTYLPILFLLSLYCYKKKKFFFKRSKIASFYKLNEKDFINEKRVLLHLYNKFVYVKRLHLSAEKLYKRKYINKQINIKKYKNKVKLKVISHTLTKN
jgi:ribosomal protein S4